MLRPMNFASLFEDYECAEIIKLAEAAAFKDAALVHGETNPEIRTARITWLDEKTDADWVFDRLVGCVIAANRSQFDFDLTEFGERMQIAWYGAHNSGHFDWHVDIGDGALAKRRKLSLIVQLSPSAGYEGGDLELAADGRRGHRMSRRQGDAVLFPSFAAHCVTPVLAGERYSLTTWVHGPPFR